MIFFNNIFNFNYISYSLKKSINSSIFRNSIISFSMINIDKVTMAQAGLKVKKSMGAQWTDECQDLFKQILTKCEN